MTAVAAPVRYTPADVARLSDKTGRLYELVGGTLVEKRMSVQANWIATQVCHLLNLAYPVTRAYVFGEQPTYCFNNPGAMRRPDAALVWADRLPRGLGDDELRIAPDLVVEVVSPSNTFDDQLERVAEYLEVGVPLVLVVQPALRWVHVFRRDGSVALLRASDTLKDEPLLPGFEARVETFFPPVPQPAAPHSP